MTRIKEVGVGEIFSEPSDIEMAKLLNAAPGNVGKLI